MPLPTPSTACVSRRRSCRPTQRSKSIETLVQILYLKSISTGDFSEARVALLGRDAAGLSPAASARLKEGWVDEHDAWQKTRSVDDERVAIGGCAGNQRDILGNHTDLNPLGASGRF
jgi:hypothetical protein